MLRFIVKGMVIIMDNSLLHILQEITPEEGKILSGQQEIEKELYMSPESNMIDAKKLLDAGKLIQVRPHTRFIHFPKHTHNYIEVIYMCSGCTHHIIDGTDLTLQTGELLFLNPNATQEILAAGKEDIAVNFIILPEFFDDTLKMMLTEHNLFRDFVIDCLTGKNAVSSYMHFKVADILPIQNLVENLIWTIVYEQSNKRSINQITMGLLILQLMNQLDKLDTKTEQNRHQLMLSVFNYIEQNYTDGELGSLAKQLHYDIYWLSREIKKQTGKTYTQLIQAKRISQAAFLLSTTQMSVMEVGVQIGYTNLSYFHRLFQDTYQMTPRKYRQLMQSSNDQNK